MGSCAPAADPFPVTCANGVGYEATLNESAYTIQINTSSMALDVNGTWLCLHNGQTVNFTLTSPLTEIINETLHLTPFTKNVTTTSVSMTATYGCINKLVYFEWYLEDESSQEKTKLEFTNTVEVDSSPCTDSRFYTYTETRSSSSVTNRDGSYRIGVEVHYSDEVTTLHSIQYFDTSFIFSPTTTTSTTSTDTTTPEKTKMWTYIAIGVAVGLICIIICCCMRKNTNNDNDTNQKHDITCDRRDQTGNNSGNPAHVYMESEPPIDYDKRNYRNSPV